MRPRLLATVVLALLCVAIPARAQERFSFFQPSTPESVDRLLQLAKLRDDDVVIDLGSGDGLIPITAAKMNPKLRGRGVDIDLELVTKSNARAAEEGVGDRVRFVHQNAFDVDLSDATVITMWLFPELMRLLRPVILERARPGTRVLTSTWDLGTWPPDQSSSEGSAVYLWIVPAKVAGHWEWEFAAGGQRIQQSALIEQYFQKVEAYVRAGRRREVVQKPTLRGDEISFVLTLTLDGLGQTQHEFNGTVTGNEITGTVKLLLPDGKSTTVPWRARRTARAGYFAPTGTTLAKPAAPKPPL
jgi:hypothetical protein